MSCGIDCRHGSDLVLLWLSLWPADVALIRPLAREAPYAVHVALKKNTKHQKKKKKKKGSKSSCLHSRTAGQRGEDRGRSTGCLGVAQGPGLQRGIDTAHSCHPLQGMEELEVEFLLEER